MLEQDRRQLARAGQERMRAPGRPPVASRGARMEDYIRALRALWSMYKPDYQGRLVSFSDIDTHPRPGSALPADCDRRGGARCAAPCCDDGRGLVWLLS